MKDRVGQTFGRLTVLSRAANARGERPKWVCQCACGKTTVVWGVSLVAGDTRSCGCLARENRTNAKLTPEQVAAIRRDPRIGPAVAADYGTTTQNVSLIRIGHTWREKPLG